MNGAGELTFNSTPETLALGVAIVLATAILAWIGWQRAVKKRTMGWLELLRVLIALCIALTLNQPEWRQTLKPDERPEAAILWDASKSMETRDVINEAPQAAPLARAEAVQPLIQAEPWKPMQAHMDVTVEAFAQEGDGTDLNAALLRTLENHPRLRSLVLISDGDWNLGESPTQAATQLRMRDVPVFAIPVGSESRLPDVWIASFDAPTFAVADKPLRIPFAIESSLPREQAVTLKLVLSTGETVTKEVTLPAMGRVQDSVLWKPANTGDVKLSLKLPPVPGERYPDNNSAEAPLSVRKEELRVLIIESIPRWEYRYMRNAMERDPGVEVNTLLFHATLDRVGGGRGYLDAFPKSEELAKYDVVFLGDVGLGSGHLTAEQCEQIKRLVRDQAAGLVFLPGFQGNQQSLLTSALSELYPVVMDEAQPKGWGSAAPGRFALTDAGQRSLLTKLEDDDETSARVWSTLPGFQWYAPAVRAKAGAEVLATHSSESTRFGRVPMLVARTFGSGKILYMGSDGAWRWRRGVEDKYHYRFWGQVVRWMAYQRNMAAGENLRLFFTPDRPRTGDVLTLNANAISTTGEPLRDAVVIAQIEAPSGKVRSLRLNSAGDEAWGLFSGSFTPAEPGNHKVRLSSAEAGAPLDTVISIQGTSREKIGQPARHEVLREITALTRGQFLPTLDPEQIIKAVSALPEPEPEERRLPLWAQPLWAAFVLGLLGAFWIGRKLAGAF